MSLKRNPAPLNELDDKGNSVDAFAEKLADSLCAHPLLMSIVKINATGEIAIERFIFDSCVL